MKLYEAKETEFAPEQIREIERVILLKVIDRKWMAHIDDMDQLRQGIGLQAYGQKNPIVEYKMSGFDMFNGLMVLPNLIALIPCVGIVKKLTKEYEAKKK